MSRLRWDLHPLSEFAALRAEWDALNDRLGRPLLTDGAFVEALLASLPPERSLIAKLAAQDGTRGLAILKQDSAWSWTSYQVDNAPLGIWLLDPSIPIETGLRSLIRRLPGCPLVLSLRALDPEVTPPPAGARTRTFRQITTARISIDQTFEDWLATTSKNQRHSLQRQRRRLAEGGTSVTISRLHEPLDMAGGIADFANLEKSGWKGRAGTAVTGDSGQAAFYVRLLERLAATGEAEIWQLHYDDALAACDLCIRRDGITVVLKTAFSEALAGNKTSPAQLLHREMFAEIFARDPGGKIEFYGPFMPWHERWTNETRDIYHLNHYRWAAIAWLHQRIRSWRASPAIKDSSAAADASQE